MLACLPDLTYVNIKKWSKRFLRFLENRIIFLLIIINNWFEHLSYFSLAQAIADLFSFPTSPQASFWVTRVRSNSEKSTPKSARRPPKMAKNRDMCHFGDDFEGEGAICRN